MALSSCARVSPTGSRNRSALAQDSTAVHDSAPRVGHGLAAAWNASPHGVPPNPAETLAPTIPMREIGNAAPGSFFGLIAPRQPNRGFSRPSQQISRTNRVAEQFK